MPPVTGKKAAPRKAAEGEAQQPASMSQAEIDDFYAKLKRHMQVRNRLDEINAEAKQLRKFLSENERPVADFIQTKQLKGCEQDGRNISVINKTVKPKENPKMIYDVLTEIYENPDMIAQVKRRIEEKYIKPKTKTEVKLKIVKKRKRTAKAAGAPKKTRTE